MLTLHHYVYPSLTRINPCSTTGLGCTILDVLHAIFIATFSYEGGQDCRSHLLKADYSCPAYCNPESVDAKATMSAVAARSKPE
jgi:hypothetical protein